MAALTESETYEQEIYQLEATDPVQGGPTGIANRQAKQLANRTNWLKRKTELLSDDINVVANSAQNQINNINENGAFVPVGATLFVIGNTVPRGYLKMNGALVSRTTYAALWAYAQTALAPGNDTFTYPGLFGTGNGSTTFQLPDTRGWFPRFWSEGAYPDTDGVRALGSRQLDRVGYHQHQESGVGLTYFATNQPTSGFLEENLNNSPGYRIDRNLNTTIATDSSLGGFGETVVRNVALVGVIKF
jgi:microcystin-dependent protein